MSAPNTDATRHFMRQMHIMDSSHSNSNIIFASYLCVVPQSLFSGLVVASPCGLPLEWPLLCILVRSIKVVVCLCFKFTAVAPSSVTRKNMQRNANLS